MKLYPVSDQATLWYVCPQLFLWPVKATILFQHCLMKALIVPACCRKRFGSSMDAQSALSLFIMPFCLVWSWRHHDHSCFLFWTMCFCPTKNKSSHLKACFGKSVHSPLWISHVSAVQYLSAMSSMTLVLDCKWCMLQVLKVYNIQCTAAVIISLLHVGLALIIRYASKSMQSLKCRTLALSA